MQRLLRHEGPAPIPAGRDILALLKPITWFPPMWAFMCGVVAAGGAFDGRWALAMAGVLLAGPLVCGTSQAVNDWFDRHVDAINEPERPIPSGRVAGRWGLWIAIAMSLLSLAVAFVLGTLVFVACIAGLILAWAYSAPPIRLKSSGWVGPAAVGLSYEGLSWFTGTVLMLGALPAAPLLGVILAYSLGAHGIMTLNDFKAVEGDAKTGLASLPVTLGVDNAARLACAVMALAQLVVIGILVMQSLVISAVIVGVVLAAQCALMPRLLRDPARFAPWYNATGVTLYVLGMLGAALGFGGYLA